MSDMQSTPSVKTPISVRIIRYPLITVLLLLSLFFLQCKKEMTTTSSSAKLSFSANLLFFDTVFATGTTGSSIRIFVVHNYNNQAVVVSSIKLAGQYTSPYEINVDGVAGTNFSNIKIPANDSIYVFVQVNINQQSTNNPALIQDSLVFTTNGNSQWVDLWAFGWNAYYYMPNIFPATGPAYSTLHPGTVWKNDRPHVIFGYLFDSAGTFTIQAGTHVYFHNNAALIVDSAASLNVIGTASNPVTFSGDRLEPSYNYLPGQWYGILLYKSLACNISWAVMQNGTTGIQVDTVAPGSSKPALTMDHTIIKGMSSYGFVGEGAPVVANNCLIADCQGACVSLLYGGRYHFYQCTFADYWGVVNSFGQRSSSLLYINDYYLAAGSGLDIRRPIDAFFGNCIIYGALPEEVQLDSAATNDTMNYYFENCVIKTQHTFPSNHFTSCVFQDPSFVNPGVDNYILNGGSPASGAGNSTVGANYPIDLTGNTSSPPYAIGAYWQ